MQPLQYDPRTKQQIKDALYEMLYSPVQKQFKVRLDTIIIRNTLLGGYDHKSFNYKGVQYSCEPGTPPRKWNRLVPQLRAQMDEWLADVEALNSKELPYVLGYINQVLNASSDLMDYLRLFPDCAHQTIKKLAETCPCQTKQLSDERVAMMWKQNEAPINLMKQRMVTNLII